MTLTAFRSAHAPAVGIATSTGALTSFLEPNCAATIWQRQTPETVRDWLDNLDPDCLPHGRVIVPAQSVANVVNQLCCISDLPNGPERDWLQSDIVALANAFSDLMQASFLRLRLGVVTTNACRKFHVDTIKARLVCTYRGSGTQYGVSNNGGDPERVFAVPTGAPILLRGTLWPETPRSGLLHRSPPIEGTGESRLVLVLDQVNEPTEEMENGSASWNGGTMH